MPPFGERKGAPLPLLTQPMVAVDVRDRDLDLKQTHIDGPAATVKLDPAALMQAKVEAAGIALGKPTVMMSA